MSAVGASAKRPLADRAVLLAIVRPVAIAFVFLHGGVSHSFGPKKRRPESRPMPTLRSLAPSVQLRLPGLQARAEPGLSAASLASQPLMCGSIRQLGRPGMPLRP